MVLPDFGKVSSGTPKIVRNTGGDAAITLSGLANNAGRQAVTLDLGANWAQRWKLDAEFELAATPTAGTAVNIYGSYYPTTGAGLGNTTGVDEAYAGYNANLDASLKHLEYLGAHICTADITPTVQKGQVSVIFPKGRYLNLVVDNDSGAAFHAGNNNLLRLTPLEDSVQDAV